MRVMVYLLPIFYLGVCYGLEKVIIVFSKKRVIALILIILFIITTISTLQGDKNQIFSNGYPAMPGEIGYHEYQPMYDYLKTNLSGYITIYTEYEDQAEVFFNAKVDYEIDFKHVLDNYYSLYYDNETQRYRQFYTNTPVINNRMEYDSLISNNKTCVILKPYANHFLENSDISNIKNTLTKKVSFIGFEVYCNDL